MDRLRRFWLNRAQDMSGVSGTGLVACGTQLPTGRCVIEWFGEVRGLDIYDNIGEVVKVHGHEGATKVVWID